MNTYRNANYEESKKITYLIIRDVFSDLWTEQESLFFSRYIEKISNKFYNTFKNKINGFERGDLKFCLYNALIKGKEKYQDIKYIKAYISTIFKNNCINSIKKEITKYNNYNKFLNNWISVTPVILDYDNSLLSFSYAKQLLENRSLEDKKILNRIACGYSWKQITELDNINSWKIRKCIKNASNYDKI